MEVNVSTGQFELLTEGSLFVYSNIEDSLQLSVTLAQDFSFEILLIFDSDTTDSDKFELSSTIDKVANRITYYCHNFNSNMGTGTTAPLEIATFNNRKVYFNFWVYQITIGVRKVEYALYQGREVIDNEE